jgi:hypothetical protein
MSQRQNPIAFGYRKPSGNKDVVLGFGRRLSRFFHLLSVETEKFVRLHLCGDQSEK